jgi:hypothetical protein
VQPKRGRAVAASRRDVAARRCAAQGNAGSVAPAGLLPGVGAQKGRRPKRLRR